MMKYLHVAAIVWCCLYLSRQGVSAGTAIIQTTTTANAVTTTPPLGATGGSGASSAGDGSTPASGGSTGPPMIMFPPMGSMPQWKLVAIIVPCVVGGITLLALCCCCFCREGGWCTGCCHMMGPAAGANQAQAASPYTSASNGNDFYGGRVYQQPVASGGGDYGVYRV